VGTIRGRLAWAALPLALAAGAAAFLLLHADGARGARATDPPCQCLWVDRYDGTAGDEDEATGVAVSPDGSQVYVTGRSKGSTTGFDYVTIAYSTATGARLWLQRYDGAGKDDFATGIAVSPDGSKVFVTGYSVIATGDFDYATVAYGTAHGGLLWKRRYDGPGNRSGSSADTAYAIKVSPDGSKVFVTGTSQGNSYDYETVAYAAATGGQLWLARYYGPGNGFDKAVALAVSPDGSKVFVTGSSWSTAHQRDYATIAYNANTGARLWAQRYNGPGYDARDNNDDAWAIATSPDGSRVYVTGGSQSSTFMDYTTIAYDAASGAQVWLSRYDAPPHDEDVPSAIAVSPDGSKIFVTGRSNGVNYTYLTVGYNAADGSILWTDWIRLEGEEALANALAVSPDGTHVFVTGIGPVNRASSYAYVTYSYDAATGARQWLRTYTGPTAYADSATAVAVDPDGSKLYVTGWSMGSSNSYSSTDYATLAYPTTAP
jgi:DNA-binding beta-propeller fold protein YncE